jgi:NAD(P)-dependent dehydrogenase (short-subunit alcohol dehydrogenase family)
MRAVVTGGSRGIGRAIAQRLAADGWDVTTIARSDADVAADVSDRAAVKHAFAEVGDVDLLVNNAGVLGPLGPLAETDPDEWWRVLEVNVRGTMLPTRAVLPSMLARGSGRIVNLGSEAGVVREPPGVAYGVSKTAVLRFTELLAAELAGTGVHAFVISPGGVRTRLTEPIAERFGGEWVPPERAAELVARIATGELDALAGRYVHVSLDDLDDLLARADQIARDDLHVLRLRK